MLYPYMYAAILLIGLLSSATKTSAQTQNPLFTTHKVTLPFAIKQPALAANLTEHKGKELIFIGTDNNEKRWLSIFTYDQGNKQFSQLDKVSLPDSVIAYDIGVGEKQSLYFLTKDKLLKYIPPKKQQENNPKIEEVLAIKSIFLLDEVPSLKQRNFVKDINDDKKDDIVLPHFERLNLWLSDKNSGGWTYQPIAIPPSVKSNSSGVSFSQPPLFFIDMNFDNKSDIVESHQEGINVYLQDHTGKFSSTPVAIKISDDIHNQEWWEVDEDDGQGLDQSKLSYRYLENVKDLNGDGAPDLVVRLTKSSGVFKRTNDYEFYFGDKESGLTRFKKVATTMIAPEKTLSDLVFVDIDNDGTLEVMTSSFNISLSKIIGALLSGGIAQKFLVFTMDENERFQEKPLAQRKVKLKFSISQGQSGFPLTKVIDVNGDNFKDLIFSSDSKKINVVLAQKNSEKPYSSSVIKFATQVPTDSENILDEDINGDGKQDIIMHYGRLDDAELLKTVNVLLAN